MVTIDKNPSQAKLRQFSVLLVALPGIYLLASSVSVAQKWALVLMVAVGSIGFVFPGYARAPFLAASYATFPMGVLFSHLIFFAIYFLMLVPTAWVLRAIGRDRMLLKRDSNRKSFWVKHPKERPLEYYLRQ